jgi:hypothetical protein
MFEVLLQLTSSKSGDNPKKECNKNKILHTTEISHLKRMLNFYS